MLSAVPSTSKMSRKDGDESVIRIPPFFYIHVLNLDTSVTTLEIGPQTYTRKDNQRVVLGPERMITIPPGSFCIVENPVVRKQDGTVKTDNHGQAELHHAEQETRLSQVPFAPYPGEVLKQGVSPLKVVTANTALRLRALVDFEDTPTAKVKGEKEGTGQEKGKGQGKAVKKEEREEKRGDGEREGDEEREGKEEEEDGKGDEAENEEGNGGEMGKGEENGIEKKGAGEDKGKSQGEGEIIMRTAGDEWLFRGPGAYIPRKEVAVEETIKATVVKSNQAIKLRARKDCFDCEGKQRVTGEEWLVTKAGAYLPDVYEEVVDVVNAYVLTSRQYCVMLDPTDDKGKPQLGRKKLIKGEASFFLMPGEQLENGIQSIYVLGEQEGLILRAHEKFAEPSSSMCTRHPGDRWMITGPTEYVPPIEVKVVCQRQAIPLDENEGIYVRDIKNGKLRAVSGETYMLAQDEELWEKELPPSIEELLITNKDPMSVRGDRSLASLSKGRDKTRVVTFRVPPNGAVQVYDYKETKARVVLGPDQVMLGPNEQFTQLNLSGGKPKKPNSIKSLCLLLGPDFCTDVIAVETEDHVRLSLQLSYNWHFRVPEGEGPDAALKFFSIPDFVGDACNAIASRIRSAVAKVTYDVFHKKSAEITQESVFGRSESKAIREEYVFEQNNLVITRVDIQSVELMDQFMRDGIQMLVEKRIEQKTKGLVELQKVFDEAMVEVQRKRLLGTELADFYKLTCEMKAEDKLISKQNERELYKAKNMADVEVTKFIKMVEAIGPETLKAMALAGPEMQVKLLQSLGLKSTLITDGSSPINLFDTANGLIGGGMAPLRPVNSRRQTTGDQQ